MKISTEINSIAQFVGMEEAVRIVADSGFDGWDFTLNVLAPYDWGRGVILPSDHPLCGEGYLEYSARLGEIGRENGIVCNQAHSPFPVYVPAIRAKTVRALECVAAAGGHLCVVHPINDATAQENADYYAEFLPAAKKLGVTIACENMYNWDNAAGHAAFAACGTPESFVEHIDLVGDPSLVACLDIGHAEMMSWCGVSAAGMVKALGGKRLKALHIHDNDRIGDKHQIPFSMNIDFPPVVKALKEIGYDGYFTLESSSYLRACSKDDIKGGVKKMAQAARRLADMFESASA